MMASKVDVDSGAPEFTGPLEVIYNVDIDASKKPFIYHPSYNVSFFGLEKLHSFDAGKWGKIVEILAEHKLFKLEDIIKPVEATEAELLIVHTKR